MNGLAFTGGQEAVSWISGLEHRQSEQELPELALLDKRLPSLSGPAVGAQLRQSSHLRNIAIVLMTAYRLSPEEEMAAMQLAQADALVYKPLPAMLELEKLLENLILQRKKQLSP